MGKIRRSRELLLQRNRLTYGQTTKPGPPGYDIDSSNWAIWGSWQTLKALIFFNLKERNNC